jgi:hypothetical protein
MREQFADLFTVLQVGVVYKKQSTITEPACSGVCRSMVDFYHLQATSSPLHDSALISLDQDGRDFADVIAPKLPFMFAMAAKDVYYLHIFQHLVEGDTGDKRFTLTCLANAGCPCQNT